MENIKRNLDGVYFRIDTEYICFSDLTEDQQDNVMENRSEEWLKSMCKHLANTIREIGDQFDLIKE
jgi:hypothetical protein